MSKKLEVGDVVLCPFPTEERPGLPGPKLRPCLVVATRRKTMFSCETVEVAYGTSVQKRKPGASVTVSDAECMARSGLDRPTKFLLGKRAIVPARSCFVQSKIGSVPERFKQALKIFLNNEKEGLRKAARRFGRKKQKPWTPSSEQLKELQNA
ncbi:type II toxin-antitoxin system PemK/MazF family toxin [Magnetovibrio sp. PR-2]|uniref:type II toxin-antitoxin system PemK/MazF family toxin n=1 Tax=Magnetovibrio sp. PR-2 TaxID=3120356 RepID=UPI002FCE06C1